MMKIILNNSGLRKLVPYLERKYPNLYNQLIIVDDHLRLASDLDVEIIVRVPLSEAVPDVPIMKDPRTGVVTPVRPTNPIDPTKSPKEIKTQLPLGAQAKMATAQQSATAVPAEIKQNIPPQAQIMSKGPGGVSPTAQVGRAGQKEKFGAEKQAMAAMVAQTKPGSPEAKKLEKELPPSIQRQQAKGQGEKEKEVQQAITDLAAAMSK